MTETQQNLRCAGILTAGAGPNAAQAARPAVIQVGEQARVLIFGYSSEASGTSGMKVVVNGRERGTAGEDGA